MEVRSHNLQPRTVIVGIRGEGRNGVGGHRGGEENGSTGIEQQRKAGVSARKWVEARGRSNRPRTAIGVRREEGPMGGVAGVEA